ncbi:mitochondrial fission ELM1 family protein [Hyphomicrobiales bacterium 4NK60-0047b]|jgi:mitochondrial fission protein ELM1
MRSQALGLAAAIKELNAPEYECKIIEKTANLNEWGKFLPGHLNPLPFKSLSKDSSSFEIEAYESMTYKNEAWPDIVISCGRRSSAISIAMGKKSAGKTYRVHVQNPQTPTKYFDLIASMKHDALKGDNVIDTKVALHKLTRKKLDEEYLKWSPIWQQTNLAPLNKHSETKKPVLGVCLGGKNKKYGFDEQALEALIQCLQTARKDHNATILLTPSSRTEPFVTKALQEHFREDEKTWIWDKEGENPYFGILTHADHLLITADSVSMISEALFTKSPVHILPLNGTSRRHKIFLENLISENLIHRVDKIIDFSVKVTEQPIDETARIAQIILQNYAEHQKNFS